MKKYRLELTDGTSWNLSPFSETPFFPNNMSATRSITYSQRGDLSRAKTEEKAPAWTLTGTIYFTSETSFNNFSNFVSGAIKRPSLSSWTESEGASQYPLSEYMNNLRMMKFVSEDSVKTRFVWVELNGLTRTKKGQIIIATITFNALSFWLQKHTYGKDIAQQGSGMSTASFDDSIIGKGSVYNHGIAPTTLGIEILGYSSSFTLKSYLKGRKSSNSMSVAGFQFGWNISTYAGPSVVKIGDYFNEYFAMIGMPLNKSDYDENFMRKYKSLDTNISVGDQWSSRVILPSGFETDTSGNAVAVHITPYQGTIDKTFSITVTAKYRLIWYEKFLTD